jgi:hypothetical protein
MRLVNLCTGILFVTLGAAESLDACDMNVKSGQAQITRQSGRLEVLTPSMRIQTRPNSLTHRRLPDPDEDNFEDLGRCRSRSKVSQTVLPSNSGVSVNSSSVTICQ